MNNLFILNDVKLIKSKVFNGNRYSFLCKTLFGEENIKFSAINLYKWLTYENRITTIALITKNQNKNINKTLPIIR